MQSTRNWISKDSERFKPESGRYHLYLGYVCPFAQRTHIGLVLKGLQQHISLSLVHPVYQKTKPDVDDHVGWVFKNDTDEPIPNFEGKGSFSCKGCIPDFVNNAKTIREIYDLSQSQVDRYSIPVLWDKKEKVVVNNESAEILRIINSEFNEWSAHPEVDLYPEHLRQQIDETNDWVVKGINLAVYRVGFAKNQEEYNQEVEQLFINLDRAEDVLSKSRYLVGNQLTEADVRLFVTLLRVDEVFYVLYKANKKRISDYPNLQDYLREIYQIPGVADTVNLEHIKYGYYSGGSALNPSAIVPIGQDLISDLKKQHSRDRFKN